MAGGIASKTGDDLSHLNYTVLLPYNGTQNKLFRHNTYTTDSSAGTIETGGNSLTQDLNVFYNVYPLPRPLHDSSTHFRQAGDIAWMITATALVLLMIPGVG